MAEANNLTDTMILFGKAEEAYKEASMVKNILINKLTEDLGQAKASLAQARDNSEKDQENLFKAKHEVLSLRAELVRLRNTLGTVQGGYDQAIARGYHEQARTREVEAALADSRGVSVEAQWAALRLRINVNQLADKVRLLEGKRAQDSDTIRILTAELRQATEASSGRATESVEQSIARQAVELLGAYEDRANDNEGGQGADAGRNEVIEMERMG